MPKPNKFLANLEVTDHRAGSETSSGWRIHSPRQFVRRIRSIWDRYSRIRITIKARVEVFPKE